MSIIITGLEMPTERESFNLTIKYNGTVLDTETGMQVAEAHELPPYGRLIDADTLAEHKFVCIPRVSIDGKDAGTAYRLGWNTAIEAVMENAETIIGGE